MSEAIETNGFIVLGKQNSPIKVYVTRHGNVLNFNAIGFGERRRNLKWIRERLSKGHNLTFFMISTPGKSEPGCYISTSSLLEIADKLGIKDEITN